MGYIITITTSVVSAMLVFILQSVIKENSKLKEEKKKAHEERETALENGVVCLLRVRLLECHSRCMKDGYITAHNLQSWLMMYKAYKDLGGNGMVDHMEEEIQELPLK